MANTDQVALYQEAAEALRSWANAIPTAIHNLEEANAKVYSTITSVDGEGGPHSDQILSIVTAISNELVHINEAIETIPVQLNLKAEKIEQLIATSITGKT